MSSALERLSGSGDGLKRIRKLGSLPHGDGKRHYLMGKA
jgi:hypothetical protein